MAAVPSGRQAAGAQLLVVGLLIASTVAPPMIGEAFIVSAVVTLLALAAYNLISSNGQ